MKIDTVAERELAGEALQRFPPTLLEEFRTAWDAMSGTRSAEQLAEWAQIGVGMAGQTARAWEVAGRFFQASPKVADLVPFSYFLKWSECGAGLCQDSPRLATSYFEASPKSLALIRSRHIETWAGLGRRLYKGTWKSGTLSCKFFEASPDLLKSLTLLELERYVAFLEALSIRSQDIATECVSLGQQVFPLLGDGKDVFFMLASVLAETNWRQVKGFMETTVRAMPGIGGGQRSQFLSLVDRLRRSGAPVNVPAAMLGISGALAHVDKERHARLLELADALLDISPAVAPEFIRSCPSALERVTMSQLERWYSEGVDILKHNGDGGMAYFRIESARSQKVLEGLSSSVEYERIKDLLEMYCRALAGADVSLAPSRELVEKNIGWVSGEAPSTEGSTVFVPSQVDRYGDKDQNFAWFKVISTHQVAHLEFGSFEFEFELPSTQFKDLRMSVEAARRPPSAEGDGGLSDPLAPDPGWVTDMQRFFALFDDRALALDIFAVVEDGRLDSRVRAEYPGIVKAYARVQSDALEQRPDLKSLPTREAMVEFLVRVTLRSRSDRGGLLAPSDFADEARRVARFVRRALKIGATVEDAAEATLRVYALISQIPNREVDPDSWQNIDLDSAFEDEPPEAGDEEMLEQLSRGSGSGPPREDEQGEQNDYEPSQDVDYRGDFKPEVVQLLSRLRQQSMEEQGTDGAETITQEMLAQLLESSAELDPAATESVRGTLADNMLKEARLNLPVTPDSGHGPFSHVEDDGGPLGQDEPQTFVYDEWDFRADDYKPRWCVVRQKVMPEGDTSYYGSTLYSYRTLVAQIRRQFELMVPEMFRKVRKLEDGEEIDIDDVIEALIDIRTGVGPSEKLYWRRNKVQRDVAVVFLLDTSASTAEAIDDSRNSTEAQGAPDDPVEYMAWLKSRRGEGKRHSYKRIIDLEKEAVVLLINALEGIGDVYGIYAFSGYGRENVEFFTIKDIEESLSESVKKRIDRIAPLHATRMGPAIRHATSKLEAREARTKLLFLISDGRPQDRGYSREGVEKEYAVHDTKKALDEARDKNITAFCLTVDKNGHDYLKTMCEDIGYEVLDDIHSLPRRLLYLYRRLTM